MIRRAWLLARVSTTKRSQDESPENQLATLRAYCERKGWRVVGEGQDRMSGAKFDRPALVEALTAVRAGQADALCVTDLDRLGRDVRELIATADELRDRGVVLVVARMGGEGFVDTSTAMGRMTFVVLAAFAEFFRNLYREKSVEGQQRAREKGKRIGRPQVDIAPGALAHAADLRARGRSWHAIGVAVGVAAPTIRRAVLAAYKSGGANAAQQTP